METEPLTKFMMFENNSNVCWLDSSMTLIAHNKTIEKIAKDFPDSKLNQIIVMYNEAISILNDTDSPTGMENRVEMCKEKLLNIQASILQYLQPILKNEAGEPDSAFCALLNLVYENKFIKDHLSISWIWKKCCANCGIRSISSPKPKPIITLPKVNEFVPDCPTSIYLCSCKTEQVMRLVYKQLPQCLIFHFEQGAGDEKNLPLFFTIKDRKYQLTCVIILEKGKTASVNHFVTFIRDPFTDNWLECNDLNMEVINFSDKVPEFCMKDVYIFAFETFDNKGKLNNELTERSQEHDSESSVELIDISDESVDLNTELKNSTLVDTLNNIEKSVSDLTLQDCLPNSNQAVCEETKVVFKDVERSDFINVHNLKFAEEKNHSEVSYNGGCVNNKEIKNSDASDFKYAVSNIRFLKRSSQVKSKVDFLMPQPKSDSDSSLMNRTKVESEPKSSEIKTDGFYNDSSGFRNSLKRTEKDSLLSSSMDVLKQELRSTSENSSIIRDKIESKPKTFQKKDEASYNDTSEFNFKKTEKGDFTLSSSNIDIPKQRHRSASENSFLCRDKIECKSKYFQIRNELTHEESSKCEKNETVDAFEMKQKLPHVDLSKSFDKSNFKSKFSDTNNNLNGTQKLCCQKKNCSCDKSKDQFFSERKDDSAARKRKKSGQQLHEKIVEESTPGMEDRQNIIPLKVPKLMTPHSKTQKNKTIGYDGHELQLRMKHSMLKRSGSQSDCTNMNFSKTSEENSLFQKKSGDMSPKYKKIEQIQESDTAELQDLSDVNLGVYPEGCKAFPVDESVTENRKRKFAPKNSSSKDTSYINSPSASSKSPSRGASSKSPSRGASSKSPSRKDSSKKKDVKKDKKKVDWRPFLDSIVDPAIRSFITNGTIM